MQYIEEYFKDEKNRQSHNIILKNLYIIKAKKVADDTQDKQQQRRYEIKLCGDKVQPFPTPERTRAGVKKISKNIAQRVE